MASPMYNKTPQGSPTARQWPSSPMSPPVSPFSPLPSRRSSFSSSVVHVPRYEEDLSWQKAKAPKNERLQTDGEYLAIHNKALVVSRDLYEKQRKEANKKRMEARKLARSSNFITSPRHYKRSLHSKNSSSKKKKSASKRSKPRDSPRDAPRKDINLTLPPMLESSTPSRRGRGRPPNSRNKSKTGPSSSKKTREQLEDEDEALFIEEEEEVYKRRRKKKKSLKKIHKGELAKQQPAVVEKKKRKRGRPRKEL